ncbi:MAG: sigma-70 family RNA polymerase sigma factor [Actinomycetota bacterium]
MTRLLGEACHGNRKSFDQLFPLVYDELRRIAHRQRRGGRGGETLETHALVHEAYLRLVDQSRADWKSRGHFSAVAAKAMRHILIDNARRRGAAKRGGDQTALPIDAVADLVPRGERTTDDDLIVLDGALNRLEATNPRLGRIVELKFFGGMRIEEIAETLELSPATVKRGWATARAWLYREMEGLREGDP